MATNDKAKKAVPKKEFVLKERSDIDPHEPFVPEKHNMEDWGDGFYVNREPVVVERNEDGSIRRTTPLSEATPDMLRPKIWKDGEIVEAKPIPKPAPPPQRPKETVVKMLAALLMRYYASAQPGQLPYNPLYDGIPTNAALGDDRIFEPNKMGTELVHVSAEEVHSWLKQVIGKRAEILNAKTGQLGWKGDISDLVVSLDR